MARSGISASRRRPYRPRLSEVYPVQCRELVIIACPFPYRPSASQFETPAKLGNSRQRYQRGLRPRSSSAFTAWLLPEISLCLQCLCVKPLGSHVQRVPFRGTPHNQNVRLPLLFHPAILHSQNIKADRKNQNLFRQLFVISQLTLISRLFAITPANINVINIIRDGGYPKLIPEKLERFGS